MSEMTLAAHEWKNTDWKQKRTLCKVLQDQVELDIDLAHFTVNQHPIIKRHRNERVTGRNRSWDSLCWKELPHGTIGAV
jgi:hypothetical protein